MGVLVKSFEPLACLGGMFYGTLTMNMVCFRDFFCMSIKKLCSRFSVVLANNNRICSQAEHKNRRPSHILLASYYRHTRYCMPPSKLAILAGERTCIPEFKVCRPIELYCFAPSPYLEHPCIAHEIEDPARNFDHVRFSSILRTLLTSA